MPKNSRIIVVANRLPVHRTGAGWESSGGGLVTALEPVLKRRAGLWVGWSGKAGRAPRRFRHEGVSIVPVALSEREEDEYYNHISNRTLWPLYHDAIRPPEFEHAYWKSYEKVNARYAEAAIRVARPKDTIWVHDYHLQLVPQMIRRVREDVRIGFFLHIPFPPEELFAWLPWREEILRGMLGADLVGFQTHASAQNFSRACRQFAGATGAELSLQVDERTTRIGSFPVSIDFDWFDAHSSSDSSQAAAKDIRKRVGAGRRIMLAVDRLDYTKGIDLRIRAFDLLLKSRRVGVNDCVLVQIASPSREAAMEYGEMRTRIEQLVGRINGEHGIPGRFPVHYFRRSFTREELTAYYRAADVMLVTPLRDGMNLVCKEYIACKGDGSGVLVLSEFAGAARQLRRALLVNPRDIEAMADAMHEALTLQRSDARQRMAILRMMVRRHDVHEWAESFLEAMEP